MSKLIRILLALSFSSTVLVAQEATEGRGWKQWSHAWKVYLAHPSKRNGNVLYNLLPSERVRFIPSKENRLPDPDSSSYFSIYEYLWSLEPLILKQDRMAVRIGFKLLTICDADFCETLHQILGKLIRKDPKMFLEELSIHEDIVGDFGGLLCNLGDDFVDQKLKQNQEIQLRIQSLEGVTIASLRSTRDECIKKLRPCMW